GVIETEVIEHKLQIATVGLEIDVEDIAEQRHAAGHHIEPDIDEHLEKLVIGHAEAPGLVDNEEADRSRAEVADARDQTDDRVRAEREPRARNPQRRIHQSCETANPAKTHQPVDWDFLPCSRSGP